MLRMLEAMLERRPVRMGRQIEHPALVVTNESWAPLKIELDLQLYLKQQCHLAVVAAEHISGQREISTFLGCGRHPSVNTTY